MLGPAQRIARILRAFGGASPERPRLRGKPRLAITIGSAPDITAALPAVCIRVPLREAKGEINAHQQPAGTIAQADQFIAELRPRPTVLQPAEHAVIDHGHPGCLAPVVGAARPIDGNQHEFRHGRIVTPAPGQPTATLGRAAVQRAPARASLLGYLIGYAISDLADNGCSGLTGSASAPKRGCWKSNSVNKLPMAGRTFGTYRPGVAFGRLSSLKLVSGDSRQLASMNFRIETWSL